MRVNALSCIINEFLRWLSMCLESYLVNSNIMITTINFEI